MPDKEKKYTIRSLTSRGMPKKDDGRKSRAMNVELSYPQYCKLRMHSFETGVPMKYLLLHAYSEKWGPASDLDVKRYEGEAGLPPIEPRSTDSIKVEHDPFTGRPIQNPPEKSGLSDTPVKKTGMAEVIPNPIAAKLFLRHRVKDPE